MSAQYRIYAYEHAAIAPIQVLIAWGRSSGDPTPLREALALLEAQGHEPEQSALPWRHIKALTLQALAYQELGDGEQALAVLTRALGLAEPEGYVRLFADEGAPLAALLAAALDAAPAGPLPSRAYLRTLLAECGQAAATR